MELKVFKNAEFGELRTLEKDETVWFIAADVCKILDLSNPSVAVGSLDEDEKAKFNLGLSGGETNCVNESGLYSLILRSSLPKAKEFKRWVTGEVLPSIRKHGVYATGDFLTKSIAEPMWAIGVLTELKARQDENALLKVQLAEARPKIDYCDSILQCPDLITTSQIAKDYGMSGKAFNKILNELGVQFRQGDLWLLYQKYARLGWTQTKSFDYENEFRFYWTQKGRLGLYHLLKEKGFLPLIEVAA